MAGLGARARRRLRRSLGEETDRVHQLREAAAERHRLQLEELRRLWGVEERRMVPLHQPFVPPPTTPTFRERLLDNVEMWWSQSPAPAHATAVTWQTLEHAAEATFQTPSYGYFRWPDGRLVKEPAIPEELRVREGL